MGSMKKGKKLITINGRWLGKYGEQQHIYIGAYNKTDAARICTVISEHSRGWINEINKYFSIGCWGDSMDGIKPERGAWIRGKHSNKPIRVL